MIACKKISGAQREDYLFKMCGWSFLQFENLVYSMADRFSEGEYTGGYWEFFELYAESSDATGFYMQWVDDEPVTFASMNGFHEKMSPEAFSIAVNLFALCYFSNKESTHQEKFIEYYHLLREYAINHEEGQLILAAID